MEVRESGASVQVINANTLRGDTVDAATATGDLDLYPGDIDAGVYVLTHNLSGAVNVGLNTRNARRGKKMRVVRNSASPAANAITVKSGTAAAGSTIGRAIAASRNGWVEAMFDGTAWVCIGMAEYT